MSWKEYNFFRDLKFYLFLFRNHIFNKTVRSQFLNYKRIPIIIINYNQLSNLRRMIRYLQRSGYNEIVIIDNQSNYKPLLQYYAEIEKEVTIFRFEKNYGHRVFWLKKDLFREYTKGYYAITDPDILPDDNCPPDFLWYFKRRLDKYPQVDKVGFSLRIDNIPLFNKNKQEIIEWEQKYWKSRTPDRDFFADIDTTFALYRPGPPFITYKGIRSNHPYIAEHTSWYKDYRNLSEEDIFYLETANSSSSWKTDAQGKVIYKGYR